MVTIISIVGAILGIYLGLLVTNIIYFQNNLKGVREQILFEALEKDIECNRELINILKHKENVTELIDSYDKEVQSNNQKIKGKTKTKEVNSIIHFFRTNTYINVIGFNPLLLILRVLTMILGTQANKTILKRMFKEKYNVDNQISYIKKDIAKRYPNDVHVENLNIESKQKSKKINVSLREEKDIIIDKLRKLRSGLIDKKNIRDMQYIQSFTPNIPMKPKKQKK